MASNFPRLNLFTPVGRYISGDHLNKRATDMDNKPIAEEDQTFDFGVAVRKDAPGINDLLTKIYQYAITYYQNNADVAARINKGFDFGTKQGGFSWKIKNGDQPDSKGKSQEHAIGCWVFYFSSKYPTKAANPQNVEIDPKTIKRGYYVDVAFSIGVNELQGDRAGIYSSPVHMRLHGYGPEIVGGITADQAFGTAPVAWTPPGMSAMPVATAFPEPQGQQPQQMPYQQQPQQMPYQQQPQQMPYQQQPQQMPQFPNGMPSPNGQILPSGAPGNVQGFVPNAAVPQPQMGFVPTPGPSIASPSNQLPNGQPPFGNQPSTTVFPIDPRTNLPVQPHPQFLNPGQR